MNSQLDQQSVSSESVSEQDHHGQENVTVQPEATQGGSVWGSIVCSRLLSGGSSVMDNEHAISQTTDVVYSNCVWIVSVSPFCLTAGILIIHT